MIKLDWWLPENEEGGYVSVCVCMCVHICSVTSSVTCQFFVHGIHQARILAWVAISFSRGIFPTQGWNLNLLHLLHWPANSLALPHLGSPMWVWKVGIIKEHEENLGGGRYIYYLDSGVHLLVYI